MGDVPTNEEAREAIEAAMIAALGMTKSKQRAEELVQDAFEACLTTRPWSRKEHSFKHHLFGAVWSLTSHQNTSKRPANERAAAAGWHREEAGFAAPSPEDRTLHRAEEEGRQTSADEELDALDASLGDNEVARRVLRCRRDSEAVKAREIAEKLGLAPEQVYRANEVIRDHLRALRKKRGKDPGEE